MREMEGILLGRSQMKPKTETWIDLEPASSWWMLDVKKGLAEDERARSRKPPQSTVLPTTPDWKGLHQ